MPAASTLGDAAAVLRHFLIRTGLLLTPAPDTLHFVHRTFQNYLGARAAVEAGDFGLLAEHACDDQWSDVIRTGGAAVEAVRRPSFVPGAIPPDAGLGPLRPSRICRRSACSNGHPGLSRQGVLSRDLVCSSSARSATSTGIRGSAPPGRHHPSASGRGTKDQSVEESIASGSAITHHPGLPRSSQSFGLSGVGRPLPAGRSGAHRVVSARSGRRLRTRPPHDLARPVAVLDTSAYDQDFPDLER